MTPDDKTTPTGHRSAAADSRAAADTALLEAFGGVRGMVDTTVPGLVFVLLYTINRDIHLAALAALGLTVLLALTRLVRKETLKHAFSGVFGVAFGAIFAMMSGDAKNFYLPGMLYTLGLAIAYILSAIFRFPLIGVLLGPMLKENLSWRTRNPGRFRAYTRSTWAWGLILLAKSAVLFPLYWWGDATQLGWVKVALGIPPFLLCVYLTWIFLAKAPPPIDVIAEMEAEEKAERERKSQADKADKVADPLLSEWTGQIVSEARTESADRQPPRH
ncbi:MULTISPECIES: DUF3159 domain-containing protein [Streptomyces]|uniref:DUF3159 domain-containing protein n=3 Tax=Streptomyces TaxID=1883 RepID=A0ABD5J539_9ACTN|nr:MULTISPECIES: DUF3159 domain-containing protein [Streptomyces]KUL67260.1 hypothetical protein ADL28_00305 [Streptomyces violaceusniger]MEE4583366.1 DUF3159 domain-containing protein [Streptomyces sp. DSM 41602]RSS32926.1 DUF3159 domain-containing protein [Streptomyces sp. WAC05858]